MPAGSKVEDVEGKLKKEYGSNKHAVYGTLNKIGLMHGNQPTAKGLKPAKHNDRAGSHAAHEAPRREKKGR